MGFPIHLTDRAMQVYPFRDTDRVTDRTVLTIGNFDGVHLGHQALIPRSWSRPTPGIVPAPF